MTGDLETSSITWGGTRLPYAIRRSARRKKTVAMAVDPAGDVLLVAPKHFSTSRLDAVVRRKAAWIAQRRRHVQSHDLARILDHIVDTAAGAVTGASTGLRTTRLRGRHDPSGTGLEADCAFYVGEASGTRGRAGTPT